MNDTHQVDLWWTDELSKQLRRSLKTRRTEGFRQKLFGLNLFGTFEGAVIQLTEVQEDGSESSYPPVLAVKQGDTQEIQLILKFWLPIGFQQGFGVQQVAVPFVKTWKPKR